MSNQSNVVTREDLEKLAAQLDDMICAADDAGDERLSKALNRACDAIEEAGDAIALDLPVWGVVLDGRLVAEGLFRREAIEAAGPLGRGAMVRRISRGES